MFLRFCDPYPKNTAALKLKYLVASILRSPRPPTSSKLNLQFCWMFIAGLALTGSLRAQTNSATIIGNCRSLSLAPVTAQTGTRAQQWFTTSDGVKGFPTNVVRGTSSLGFSGEFRPVLGTTGVYEADYVSYVGDQISDSARSRFSCLRQMPTETVFQTLRRRALA